ncbi:MAG: tetratricopeptide repeat protein [Proteobacteria bacterium]|nr:tetratricopeptide repeat protein [Pseudomonadota bacterium]
MIKHSFPIALLVVLLPAVGAAEDRGEAKKAREHYQQAEMYMKAKVYDLAVTEYRKGYELAPQAHGFLFNIGLAYERMGDNENALAAFEKYLQRVPRGKKTAEARARSVALRRAIAAAQKNTPAQNERGSKKTVSKRKDRAGIGPDRAQNNDRATTDDRDKSDRTKNKKLRAADQTDMGRIDRGRSGPEPSDPPVATRRRSWTLIAIGAALIAAGVVADVGPDSSSNDELDTMDFVPVGLYGAGALLMFRGTF